MLAGLAIIGIVFVRSPLSVKLGVLVLLAMAIVATGILMPMLATRFVDQAFAAGLGCLGLLWLVGAFARRRPSPRPSPPLVVKPAANPDAESREEGAADHA